MLEGTHAEIEGDPATEIAGLAYDNRKVADDTLFFCVPGATADGHDFAPAAVEAGASALVVERPLGLGVTEALVPDARAAMAPAAVSYFGDPTRKLRVAGITGTNGKTTTAFLVRHILERTGTQTGLLGTVKSVIGGFDAEVERTTPEAIDLQATFRSMLDAGDEACAMEVSSHALTLGRARGITFGVAVFTNLTQDHLDFHSDMEDYFRAKRLLFEGPEHPPVAVVNLDDPFGARLAQEIADAYGDGLVTFSGSGHADAVLRAVDVEFNAAGSRFVVEAPFGAAVVEMPLPGDFNVQNALAALGAAIALGADGAEAAHALADADRVPGRMEPIDEGQPFSVLVDYAHTPDSLENVLEAARRLTADSGRVICVFGCGGDRDREKRPLMGAIASRLADVPVVTSDNPRSEEPESIVAQIRAGMERDDVVVEVDRRAAIRLALEKATGADTVVIAGKGHEQGQEFEGGHKIPFDDRDVARDELRAIGARS